MYLSYSIMILACKNQGFNMLKTSFLRNDDAKTISDRRMDRCSDRQVDVEVERYTDDRCLYLLFCMGD